jgi:hypothetical protein
LVALPVSLVGMFLLARDGYSTLDCLRYLERKLGEESIHQRPRR